MLFNFTLPKEAESRTAQLELVYYLSGICTAYEINIIRIDFHCNTKFVKLVGLARNGCTNFVRLAGLDRKVIPNNLQISVYFLAS